MSESAAWKAGARERLVGLDPDDEAAKWLRENDPAPESPPPKSARKSKALHQWRQRQARGNG